MRKLYHLVLPVSALALLLAIMVWVAFEGYHIQHLNAEWVEFVEHWIDQREEAVEDLEEYLHSGKISEYREYVKVKERVDLYTRAANMMKNPDVPKQQAKRVLAEKIGYQPEEAGDLIWHARTVRPFLGIVQDYRKWNEITEHWKNLETLENKIRKAHLTSGNSKKLLEKLENRLNKFVKISRRFNSEIQTAVEKASEKLKSISKILTISLSLFLLISGVLLIGVIYRNARQNQKKFRTLFENSPDAIVIASPDGRAVNFNQSFQQLFKYSKGEIIGQNLDDLLTSTGAEHKEAEQLTEWIRQNKIYRGEVTRYDKSGNPIPVLLSAVPVVIQGKVQWYYAIYIDIRQQKELEEKNRKLLERERTLRAKAEESHEQFKEMFEKSPSAVALVEGPDLEFTYTNKMHRQLTGKNPLGLTVREMFPESENQDIIDKLEHVYKTGEVHEGTEEPVEIELNGDRVTYYWDYVYIPLKDEEGETYAIFMDAVDVTDKVEYRRQLQQELKEKTTLLEEIHHRVKNNLASITGMLQLQLSHIDNQQAKEALIDSELRIHTLANIHELLYESRKLSEIDMNAYITKLVNHISQIATKNDKIETKINVESFTLGISQAQPLALLLTELLQNSYKHAFPDYEKGEVTISGAEKKGKVRLTISDNGVGIKDRDQLDKGLGMELIESFQKQLDAKVDVSNENGTHYTIEFDAS